MEEHIDFLQFSRKHTDDLGPPSEAECLAEFRTKKTVKNLGSLLFNTPIIVDEALKSAIEEIEPDIHQFWSMKVTRPNGEPYQAQYYGLRIGQFRDSFCPDKSEEGSFKERYFFFGRGDSRKSTAGLAFSKKKIAGAHLWREQKIRQPDILMSDEMQAKIAEKGLRIPKHYPVKEV